MEVQNESQRQEKNTNNTIKTTSEDLKGKFLKGYFENKNETEIKDLYNLTKDIQTSSLPPAIKTSLEIYKSLPDNNKIFEKLKISDISRFDIIRELMSAGGIKLESSRKHLEELLSRLYIIDNLDKPKLSKELEELNQSEIENLIKSESQRDLLLNKVFKDKKIEKTDIISKLKNINGLDYNSLNDEQKIALKCFVDSGYETTALIELLKEKFTIEQKKALLKAYMGPTSLGKLQEYKLINKDEIDVLLEKKARELLKSHLSETEINEKINEIKKFVSPYSIIIPPDEIFSYSGASEEEIVNKLLDRDVFQNLFRDAREQANKQEETEKKLTKEEFFEKLKEFNTKIPNLSSIKKGDVVKCEVLRQNSTQENSADSSIIDFIYIKIEDIGDDFVAVKNITHDFGGDKINEDLSKTPTENFSFSDMLNFFGKAQLKEGEVISEKDFAQKIKDKEIKTLPNDGENIQNIEQLERMINEEDSEGVKFGLKQGTVFEFTPQKAENTEDKTKKTGPAPIVAVASVVKIDGNNITIRSQGEHIFSLKDFYNSFVGQNSKRIANIKDNSELLQSLQTNSSLKGYSDLEWDKDKINLIYTPQKDNKDFGPVDHFVNKDGECLKIEKNDNSGFNVLIGEYKEKSGKDPKDKDKTITNRSFESKFKSKMTPEIFYAYIAKKGMEPLIIKDNIKVTDEPNKNGLDEKISPMQAIFRMQNFASLMAGGKQFIDHIKSSLKNTSDLQAAEFALTLGSTLPKSMRSEFQAKVDGANKKKMNDKIGELENLGAGPVMEYIVERLSVKNLPRYELEALLIFVMRKHGSLYPTKLSKHAGSYMWFKKIAGLDQDYDIRNHKIFREYSDIRKQEKLPIVEEDLIEKLLIEQSKASIIRSSFVGDFLGAYGEGREKQKSDGYKECKEKYPTTKGKIDFTIKERIKNGRYMQAIGAIEGILDKGGSAEQMARAPFLLMASGILRTLDANVVGNHLKGLGAKHREPILLFCASPEKLDIFDQVVLDLSSDIGSTARKKYEEILEARAKGATHEDLIDKSEKFWTEYGIQLATKLNNSDPDMMIKAKEKGGAFKDYQTHANNFLSDSRISKDHKDNGLASKDRIDFMASGAKFLANNLTGLSGFNKSMKDQTQETIFNSLIEGLDDIKKIENKDKQRKVYQYYNKEIVKWLVKNNSNLISKNSLKDSIWGNKLVDRLWIPTDSDLTIFNHDEGYIDSSGVNAKIDEHFEKFLKNKIVKKEDAVKTTQNKIKLSINDVLNMPDGVQAKGNANNYSNSTNKDLRSELKSNLDDAEFILSSYPLNKEDKNELTSLISKGNKSLKNANPKQYKDINNKIKSAIEEIQEKYSEEYDIAA